VLLSADGLLTGLARKIETLKAETLKSYPRKINELKKERVAVCASVNSKMIPKSTDRERFALRQAFCCIKAKQLARRSPYAPQRIRRVCTRVLVESDLNVKELRHGHKPVTTEKSSGYRGNVYQVNSPYVNSFVSLSFNYRRSRGK
jgi:hypothetical protein